ncbi:MAG: hypothetical protein V4733_07660 [Verrucomicrobiota bacterium]
MLSGGVASLNHRLQAGMPPAWLWSDVDRHFPDMCAVTEMPPAWLRHGVDQHFPDVHATVGIPTAWLRSGVFSK